jgi:aerobic carbon-monoxide dehydrogenase large subunit
VAFCGFDYLRYARELDPFDDKRMREAQRLAFACRPPRRVGDAFQILDVGQAENATDHLEAAKTKHVLEQRPQEAPTLLLEAAEADIEFADGKFSVAGTDRNVPFAQVAFAAYVPHNYPIDTLEPGLNETAFYDPINFTYPVGAYVAEIEIDRETGTVELVNFTGADDFGRIINPLIVEGQVHGALVQGIGQALYENAVYDESGQLETGSFMDYCMPRADHFLPFKLETNTTLCAHNPLGAKGCGEAGTIGAPPAIVNAVIDALAPLGIVDIDMPATSERVWRAMASHGKSQLAH